MRTIDIEGCAVVPVLANADARGCLFEVFRQEWPGAFETVQWNACVSKAGVMRGVHSHVDYSEFYTLPKGRVHLVLKDIRPDSPTFMRTAGFDWSDADSQAIVVPPGVAHAMLFYEDSVLVFGLSGYWTAEMDVLGCRWDDPDFYDEWPAETVSTSPRDAGSGGFAGMVEGYRAMAAEFAAKAG